MTLIAETYDSSAPVALGRPDGGMGDYIEGLKDDCGFIIPKIDWAVEKLTGWSLLEALLVKIAGDFNAVASMQLGWGQVGLALEQTGANYEGLAGQLPGVWEGESGSAAAVRLSDVGSMHADQAEACTHLQDQLGHILEVAQATAEVVAAAINFIDDVIQELLLDAAVPVLGWAKGAFSAPGKAKKVIDLIHRGLEAIERFTRACRAVVTVLKYVNAGLTVLDSTVSFGNVVASGAAGGHVDETSDRGFG
jgi:hypothetical protein